MNMTKKTSGRPHRVSRVRKEETSSLRETPTEQKIPLLVKHRKPAKAGKVIPEKEVIIHSPVEAKDPDTNPGRTRNNPLVYEAMEVLRNCGYMPVRLTEPTLPINLLGMNKNGDVLILALRSRKPVPNAATLYSLFTGKIDPLRRLAGMVMHKIMIWVYSPACGWRYYLVYPGGLRYDLDFPASMI